MEEGKFKVSYLGGMDQDTTPENYQGNKFYDAYNFRLTLDEESNFFGRLINEKSFKLLEEIPDTVTGRIIPLEFQPEIFISFKVTYSDTSEFTQYIGNADDYDLTTDEGVSEAIKKATELNLGVNFNANAGLKSFLIQSGSNGKILESAELIEAGGSSILVMDAEVSNKNYVIGGVSSRNKIILFTVKDGVDDVEPSNTGGSIWEVDFDPHTKTSKSIDIKFYSSSANFSSANPIKALSVHENDFSRKVYWIDGFNNLRFFNLEFVNGLFTSPSNLELSPNVTFGKIDLTSKSDSGEFIAGTVKYAYQQYNKYGNQTSVSPISNEFTITDASGRGGEINSAVACSFGFEIIGLSKAFSNLKIFRLHYTQQGVSPEITLITDTQIGLGNEAGSTSIKFFDTGGVYKGNVSIDEFILLGSENIKPADIDAKNNILFAAGIETDDFEIDYDARAYSFKIESTELKLIDSLTNSYLTSNILSEDDFDVVPETHDAINDEFWNGGFEKKGFFKNYNNTFHNGTSLIPANGRFFKLDSNIMGGSGKNISYEFDTSTEGGETMMINKGGGTGYTDGANIYQRIKGGPGGGEKNYNNPYYFDHASHQRGEIYRFGIVFINQSGKRSFAKWIADIKIPEHYMDISGGSRADNYNVKMVTNVYDEGELVTRINPMYVKFNINITQELIDKGVVGYQIVRVDREDVDKTIIDQGYGTMALSTGDQSYRECSAQAVLGDFVFSHGYKNTLNEESGWRQYYLSRWYTEDESGDPPSGYYLYRASQWSSLYLPDNTLYYSHSRYYNATPTTPDGYSKESDGDEIIGKYLDLFQFYSPRVSYQKDLIFEENTWVDTIGCARDLQNTIAGQSGFFYKYTSFRIAYKRTVDTIPTHRQTRELKINELEIIEAPLDASDASAKAKYVGGANFYNRISDTEKIRGEGSLSGIKLRGAFGPTSAVMSLDPQFDIEHGYAWHKNGITDESGSSAEGTDLEGYEHSGPPIFNIRRGISGQYGGITYSERSNSIYSESTNVVKVDSIGLSSVVSRRGDTFIGYFKHMRKMRGEGWGYYNNDPNGDSRGYSNTEFILMPLEYSMNINAKFNEDVWEGFSDITHIRETAQQTVENAIIINSNIGNPATGFGATDQYQLNRVYNGSTGEFLHEEKPLNFQSIENRDVETRYSDVKRYNELIDSWTIFRSNNVNNVDGRYGKILGLKFFNNELFYFQENAFGKWEVNQRALVTTDEGAEVELGSGGVLDRFEYLSISNGVLSKFAIAAGDDSLLFYDQMRNKIIQIAKGSRELSVTKGINSKIEGFYKNRNNVNELQNPLSTEGVLFYYDTDEKEFLMTFKIRNKSTGGSPGPMLGDILSEEDSSGNIAETLSYTEKLDALGPRYGYTPGVYVNVSGFTVSVSRPYNKIMLHRELENSRGVFYNDEVQESSLTLILNPAPGAGGVYIFDTLIYLLSVKDWSVDTSEYIEDHVTGLTGVQIWNDYQDTGFIDLTTADITRIRKKFRKWRLGIPRNENTLERMRDTHIFVKFYFNNEHTVELGVGTSKRVSLSDMFYNVRQSLV